MIKGFAGLFEARGYAPLSYLWRRGFAGLFKTMGMPPCPSASVVFMAERGWVGVVLCGIMAMSTAKIICATTQMVPVVAQIICGATQMVPVAPQIICGATQASCGATHVVPVVAQIICGATQASCGATHVVIPTINYQKGNYYKQ